MTSTIRTSSGWISTRCRACRSSTSERWRWPRRTCSRSTGSSASPRRAGRRASTSTLASAPSGTSPRFDVRRSPSLARSSAASPTSRRRSGGRRSVTASSSTTTRTLAIGRWPPRTASGRCRTRGCRRRSTWDEVPGVEPEAFTLRTVPDRLRTAGDPGAEIDDHVGTLEPALELSDRQAREGQGEAPYPPHFPKAEGEPVRAQPSRRRKASKEGPGRGRLRAAAGAGQEERTDGAASHADAADRDRASRDRAGGDGGTSSDGRRSTRRSCRTSSRPT